jgi:hypothetical protein
MHSACQYTGRLPARPGLLSLTEKTRILRVSVRLTPALSVRSRTPGVRNRTRSCASTHTCGIRLPGPIWFASTTRRGTALNFVFLRYREFMPGRLWLWHGMCKATRRLFTPQRFMKSEIKRSQTAYATGALARDCGFQSLPFALRPGRRSPARQPTTACDGGNSIRGRTHAGYHR